MERKKKNEQRRCVETENSKGPPQQSPSYKKQASAAKLKINDVMIAVLGSDQCESSSEVSDVSSLTDTSLSDDEPELGTNIDEAVKKLKAAREKKIQMSHKKKSKSERPEKGKPKRKARKSLSMQEPRLNDLKKSTETGDASDSISLISEISSANSDMDRERLVGSNVDDIGRSNHYDKAMKTSVKDLSEQELHSGDLKLKKTPKDYAKTKSWIGVKKSMAVSETNKKLVKRKGKNIERESESDTDSDSETEDKPIPRVKRRRKVKEKKKNMREIEKSDATESDSEDETLDKIAARKIGVKEKKSEQDNKTQNNCTKFKTGDKPLYKRTHLSKLIEIHTDSESSTRYTPFAKKTKEEPKSESESECSTGDTPLAEMKKSKKSTVVDNDLDLSIGDTPLVRKKKSRKSAIIQIDTASDSNTGDTSVTKRTSVKTKSNGFEQGKLDKKLIVKKTKKSKKSEKSKGVHSGVEDEHVSGKNNQEYSDSTSGDTPLSQLKNKSSKISYSDGNTQRTRLIRKTKSKKSLEDDSEQSSGDTSLNKKQENARKKLVNSDSDADTADSPLIKKKKQILKSSNNLASKSEQSLKKKLKTMKVQNSDKDSVKGAKRKRKLSEMSTESSEDIPLVKKFKRQKLDITSSKANDAQLSDDGSGDTPLVKKKVKLWNAKTKVQSKLEIKQSSEKEDDANAHDSETSEDAMCASKVSSEISEDTDKVKGSQHNAEICDTTSDTDTPSEIMKRRHTRSMTLESSSDGEFSIRTPAGDKRSGPKKVSAAGDINGMEYSSDESSPEVIDISDMDSDDSDDVPLADISKKTIKTKISDLSSDSEDDIPLSKTKAAQSKQAKPIIKDMEQVGPTSEMAYVRLLRQICRECQMFVRNDRELAGCITDREKIEKLEQMLRDVGMKGKPTMKKAEEVKLIKEAKELSSDNIISSETGRVMRKVKSIWARRTIFPIKLPTGGAENLFGGLKGIVDSEESEST